ncbi:prepilin peptidase [Peptoniphilus equinus]|uniref:Prepilin peptidase n=1 Tax=Peptoniphilus equinus TaxID=3016343 RepID=A0ABY7QSZ9_9FIRM|nr:A24 family peptidase [Peptoniphilus equinus]WBW49283.1 prepilin peptidase [Peptoniphilus equinus]
MKLLIFLLGAVLTSGVICFGEALADGALRHFLTGRSRCSHCQAELSPWELIPIVSFVLLKGRCRHCHSKIEPMYFGFECLGGLLFVLCYQRFGLSFASGLNAFRIVLLLAISFLDFRDMNVPSVLLYAFVITVLPNFALHKVPFMVVVGGVVYLFAAKGWMGSGDVWLASGGMVLVHSWRDVLRFVQVTYISAALYAVALLLVKKRERKDAMAFLPFIALGIVEVLLHG